MLKLVEMSSLTFQDELKKGEYKRTYTYDQPAAIRIRTKKLKIYTYIRIYVRIH